MKCPTCGKDMVWEGSLSRGKMKCPACEETAKKQDLDCGGNYLTLPLPFGQYPDLNWDWDGEEDIQ